MSRNATLARAPTRLIAIDWSGDKTPGGQRKKIWIADCDKSEVALSDGRTREEASAYLINAATESPDLVAGLDFAFSYPAWFVREQGCSTAEEFWRLLAGGKSEEWLSTANNFCWGRTNCRRPDNHREPDWKGFRLTDRQMNVAGIQPKSPFQIGGAGAVGAGSLRGIPILNQLLGAGFSIWPFTPPGFPTVLEIYPRLFTGKGNKSSHDFRSAHLKQPPFASLAEEVLNKARRSEDAFDALCSVIGMKSHANDFASLRQASDRDELIEGQIWAPKRLLRS